MSFTYTGINLEGGGDSAHTCECDSLTCECDSHTRESIWKVVGTVRKHVNVIHIHGN